MTLRDKFDALPAIQKATLTSTSFIGVMILFAAVNASFKPPHVEAQATAADAADACRAAIAYSGRIYENHPCMFTTEPVARLNAASKPFDVSAEDWAEMRAAELSGIATVSSSDSQPNTNILEYTWGDPVTRALWPSNHQVHVSKIDGTWRATISRKNHLRSWNGGE